MLPPLRQGPWRGIRPSGRQEARARRAKCESGLRVHTLRRGLGHDADSGMPMLVVKDRRTKMIYALVAPQKGVDDYSVMALKHIADGLGCKRLFRCSDN